MSACKLEPLYVVGHKNPDTDAICSAIGHAELLQKIGYKNVQAIRCGDVPERTKWVLDEAGIEAPELVTDVRAMAGDLIRIKNYQICYKDTILNAYRIMLEQNLRSVPVVRNTSKVIGILKLVDLLQLMMPSQTQGIPVKTVYVSLRNALETLEGESVGAALPTNDEEEKLVMFVAASNAETMKNQMCESLEDANYSNKIAIIGNRNNVQRSILDFGVRGMVITGGFAANEEIIKKAKETNTVLIYSKHDTATTVQLMRCSRSVESALTKDFLCVEHNEAISSFKKRLSASSQDIFPVVKAGSQRLMGIFSKSDLIDPPRRRLVLVDHNEYAQAVKGVEEAQVIEVIDHHRLAGDIVTREPIAYLNELVGSTSTIIARKFIYRNLLPTKSTALCLLAGLISDTLNLKSPTTTELDKEMRDWLCKIAEVEASDFTKHFFEAGSLLRHGTADEIVGVDRKEFKEAGAFVSISQVEEIVIDALPKRMEEIREALERLVAQRNYDIAIIAITDISAQSSTILCAGSEKIAEALPYDRVKHDVWYAQGVVSRKKQIFPAMCEAINNATATEIEG